MAKIDIIDAAGQGYSFVWQERLYLAKLALLPILMKLVCYAVIRSFGLEGNIIMQGIIMLPALFLYGWMLSHVVRTILLDHRWPFKPSGNIDQDIVALRQRALGIMRGTLVFVCTDFIMTGIAGIIMRYADISEPKALEQGGTAAIFSAMLGITAVIWLFRFLWLYIPAAVNYPLLDFIKKLAPFSLSFYLIGIWLVSFLPLLLGFDLVLSSMIAALGLAPESVTVSVIYDILRLVVETALVIITTASMTYGFKQLFQKNKNTMA